MDLQDQSKPYFGRVMMNGPCTDFADPHASVIPTPSWSIVYCETLESLSMCMII
jgi:hypothetical protein